MTTERIDIVVREDGSRTVRRDLADIGAGAAEGQKGVNGLQNSLNNLKTMLAGMGIAYGIHEIIEYTDTWANLQGRLTLVTDSYRNMKEVQAALFDISQKTRVTFEGTADVYTRIARATKDLNRTDAERLSVVTNINKALIISGASAEEGQRALIQLGQGLGAGVLRGQDLNSVLEQTPRLAQAIAEGMGKTIGELKKMGEAGELTSKAVFDSLLQGGAALTDEFSRMPQTIGQSFTLLKNEMLKFIGSTQEANGFAGYFATALQLLGENLDTVSAIMKGFTAYKFAEIILGWTTATYGKIKASMEASAAATAERIATIAAAQATLTDIEAKLAQAVATRAAIISVRESVVASMAQADANIRAAQAAIAASTAAGAQSFALRVLAESNLALVVAQEARAAGMAQLAVLGAQQTRVTAEIAAATTAQAAAQAGLTAATTAGTGAMALASRALGFLGGPIGIITTLLGLGVTAWMLWGNRAKEKETEVAQTLSEKTTEIVASLDKQIEKLKERNRLNNLAPDLAKTETPAADQQRAILTQMQTVKSTKFVDDPVANAAIMSAQLQALGKQYNDLTVRTTELNTAQDKLNGTLNGDKMKKWMESHQELLSNAEQLANAIKDAKKELGGAYTDEVEKLLTSYYAKKDKSGMKAIDEQFKATLQGLEQQQKLERAIADGALRDADAQYSQGLLSQQKYIETKLGYQLSENTRLHDYTQAQLDAVNDSDKDMLVNKAKFAGELKVLEQQRVNILKDASNEANGVYAQRELAQMNADASELAGINQQVAQLALKIQGYEKLPAAVTAAAIAELEAQKAVLTGDFADQQRIATINEKIEALTRLKGMQALSAQQDYDVADTHDMGNQWKTLGDTIGNALSTGFGKGGAALQKLVQGFGAYKKAELDIKKAYDDRVKVADGSEKRIAEAAQQYADESVQARLGAFGEMAGAAKGYFSETSAGYKVLQAAEQAFHLAELVMSAVTFAKKLAFKEAEVAANTALNATKIGGEAAASAASTGLAATEASAWGITAVVKAIASLPFPLNLAAGAATLAAVVAIGANMIGGLSGGGADTTAKDRQAANGTGSILGDSSAKSDSIAHAISLTASNSNILIDYTKDMVSALKAIQSNIGGFAASVASTTDTSGKNVNINSNNGLATTGASALLAGGGALLGGSIATGVALSAAFGTATGLTSTLAALGSALGPIGTIGGALLGYLAGKSKLVSSVTTSIFGGKQTLNDSGITAAKTSLGNVMTNGLQASQYADITTSGGWFSSDKKKRQSTALDAETNAQFSLVVQSLANGVTQAAKLLGVSGDAFTQKLNSFVVDIGSISGKDLTGEQFQAALQAAFSKLGDDMASFAVGGLDKFKKVGEGSLETLVRIATDYAGIDSMLASIGKSFGAVGMASIPARENLITLAGGLDTLVNETNSYASNFLTKSEQLAPVQKYVTDQLAAMGLAGVTTRESFKYVVQGLDLSTAAGQDMYVKLMALQGAFAQTHVAIVDLTKTEEEIADERKDLQKQLDELTMSSTQLLQQQRDALDASNRTLFDQVQAAKAAQAAQQTVKDALSATIDNFKSFAESAKSLHDSLLTGDMSTLSPMAQYAQLKQQYNETVLAAKAGDADAQKNYANVANMFLSASQKVNASDPQYSADYAMVLKQSSDFASWSTDQANIAQATLDKMTEQVAATQSMSTNLSSLIEIIPGLWRLPVAGEANSSADYSTMGSTSGTDVVTAVNTLTAEVAALRADNAKLNAQLQQNNNSVALETTKTLVTAISSNAQPTARALPA